MPARSMPAYAALQRFVCAKALPPMRAFNARSWDRGLITSLVAKQMPLPVPD